MLNVLDAIKSSCCRSLSFSSSTFFGPSSALSKVSTLTLFESLCNTLKESTGTFLFLEYALKFQFNVSFRNKFVFFFFGNNDFIGIDRTVLHSYDETISSKILDVLLQEVMRGSDSGT